MEISRKEEYRNQKVSLGVTLLSFVVMLVFFIFTNIVTANSSPSQSGIQKNIMLGFDNSPGPSPSSNVPGITPSSKKENTPDKIQDLNGEVPLTNLTREISKIFINRDHNNIPLSVQPAEARIPGDFKTTEGKGSEGRSSGDSSLEFDLSARTLFLKPAFSNITNEQGKVVVEITVDKDGNVTEASSHGRGTTTISTVLKNEARKMALAAKFSPDQNQREQKGTLTIIFSYN